MILNPQAAPKKTNNIVVALEPETQSIGIGFNHEEYRSWDFIIGTLYAAIEVAKSNKQMAMMAQIQAAQQDAAIKSAVMGRHNGR